MFAFPVSKRLNVAPDALAAVIVGTLAAATTLFLPTGDLESLVMGSGVPALLAAAEPPLGTTARVLVALGAGLGAGGLTWLMAPLVGAAPVRALRSLIAPVADRLTFLRKGDVHPDAPARSPVFATRDLGTPFLEVRARKPKRNGEPVHAAAADPMRPPVEQKLPANLDVPLSAFDPAAIPTLAAEPVRAVPPLAKAPPAPAPEERIETVALTSPVRSVPSAVAPEAEPAPIATPRTDATVHALLDRLERGIAVREAAAPPPPPPPPPRPSLEEALAELRQLAMRA